MEGKLSFSKKNLNDIRLYIFKGFYALYKRFVEKTRSLYLLKFKNQQLHITLL